MINLEAFSKYEASNRIGFPIMLRTVGTHLTSIYPQLGVDSRASAVAVGIARRVLPPE